MAQSGAGYAGHTECGCYSGWPALGAFLRGMAEALEHMERHDYVGTVSRPMLNEDGEVYWQPLGVGLAASAPWPQSCVPAAATMLPVPTGHSRPALTPAPRTDGPASRSRRPAPPGQAGRILRIMIGTTRADWGKAGSMALKALGYWKSAGCPELPDPAALVDEAWDEEEQWLVSMYLDRGQLTREFTGVSRCRICRCVNGNAERMDGEYVWPSGLSHYVIDHSVTLPAEFISHVLRRLDAMEEGDFDFSWWLQQTGVPEVTGH